MTEEIIHRHIDAQKDSVEIGTPGKGGAVKVYGDFANPEDFMRRIDNAFMVRSFAQRTMEESP